MPKERRENERSGRKGKRAPAKPSFANRITSFDLVPADSLKTHPSNPRTHPDSQMAALRGIIEKLAYGDAVKTYLARAGDRLVKDGYAAPGADIPRLLTDYTESEALDALLSHDQIGRMAILDGAQLSELMEASALDIPALGEHLAGLLEDYGAPEDGPAPRQRPVGDGGDNYAEQYGVIVICTSEAHQQEIFDQLTGEGFSIRMVTT